MTHGRVYQHCPVTGAYAVDHRAATVKNPISSRSPCCYLSSALANTDAVTRLTFLHLLPKHKCSPRTGTFSYFLEVRIRHMEVFTSQFVPCQDFPLSQNSPGGGLALEYSKGLSFMSNCGLLNNFILITKKPHPGKTCVFEVLVHGRALFRVGELRQKLNLPVFSGPAGSAGHFVSVNHLK